MEKVPFPAEAASERYVLCMDLLSKWLSPQSGEGDVVIPCSASGPFLLVLPRRCPRL